MCALSTSFCFQKTCGNVGVDDQVFHQLPLLSFHVIRSKVPCTEDRADKFSEQRKSLSLSLHDSNLKSNKVKKLTVKLKNSYMSSKNVFHFFNVVFNATFKKHAF